MLTLALDTSTRGGSVAVTRGAELLDQLLGDPQRTHGERLPGDIVALLLRQRLQVADIELYAVAAGPGSFTGLRVGIATIQGLALANNRPVVPVSTLDALALAAQRSIATTATADHPAWIAAWMDAQRHEIFFALYRVAGDSADPGTEGVDGLVLVDGPAVGSCDAAVTRWEKDLPPQTRVHFIGDGALAYRDRILTTPWVGSIENPVPALAAPIAFLAERQARHGGAIPPDAIRPVYVRRPDAELARDRSRR